MQKVVMIRSALICGLAIAALVGFSERAHARPKYLVVFGKTYEDLKDEINALGAGTKKCNVCHYGISKKNHNDWGMAVKKCLPDKNVKEEDVIKEALMKAEKEKSTNGKTFGDLIKEGKLPGTAPADAGN